MGKKTTIALLVCGAYLFTSSMLNNKYQRINEKLELHKDKLNKEKKV